MRRFLSVFLSCVLCLSLCACGAIKSKQSVLEEFYNTVTESQELLDIVADDIYSYWYDAIYEDEYGEDINVAIAMATIDNEENIEEIEELDTKIAELFKVAKETDADTQVKAVMSAYSDYYELVINVSGSFKSYSENKETLKKELASTLKDLSYEL